MVNYKDIALFMINMQPPASAIKKLDDFTRLTEYNTIQLDFGRCTGKSVGALELLECVPESILMVKDCHTATCISKETGYSVYHKQQLYSDQGLPAMPNRKDKKLLICDDVNCGNRLKLQEFAFNHGFNYLIILGKA